MACGILLLGHGLLPLEMRKAAELICGPATDVEAVCLPADQDLNAYQRTIREAVERRKGDGLLILTDFRGGTPFLTAAQATRDFRDAELELVTGLSLPMLTEVLLARESGANARTLAERAVKAGRESVSDFRRMMERGREGTE